MAYDDKKESKKEDIKTVVVDPVKKTEPIKPHSLYK